MRNLLLALSVFVVCCNQKVYPGKTLTDITGTSPSPIGHAEAITSGRKLMSNDTIPNGITISGGPITYSGTLSLSRLSTDTSLKVPVYDTVRCFISYADTTRNEVAAGSFYVNGEAVYHRDHNIKYLLGYKVVEKKVSDGFFWRIDAYFYPDIQDVLVCYLDERKNKLSDNIIVLISKELK